MPLGIVTQKTVNIAEPKLFWFNLALKLLSVAYTVYYAAEGVWYYQERPSSQVAAWVDSGDYSTDTVRRNEHAGKYKYCNNPSYDYHYTSDGYFRFDHIGCKALQLLNMWSKTANGVNIIGFGKTEDLTWYPYELLTGKSTAQCDANPSSCSACSALGELANGFIGSQSTGDYITGCQVHKEFSWFAAGIEDVSVAFEHYYDTSGDQGANEFGLVGVHFTLYLYVCIFAPPPPPDMLQQAGTSSQKEKKEKTCTLQQYDNEQDCIKHQGFWTDQFVKTILLKPDGSSLTSASGGLNYKLSTWLELAQNLDLDDKQEFDKAQSSVGDYPYKRLTGVTIVVKMAYTDQRSVLNLYGVGDQFDKDVKVYCIVQVETRNKIWTSTMLTDPIVGAPGETYHTSTNYATGVRFEFESTGLLHKMDAAAFIAYVVTIVVGLSLVDSLTLFLAKYACGEASKYYRSVLKENVDFDKELANFGARRVQASAIWETVFHNGDYIGKDMQMNALEIRRLLRKKHGSKTAAYSKAQAEVMAYMIMNEADMADPGSRKGAGTGQDTFAKLDFEEWFNIFSGDRSNLNQIVGDVLGNKQTLEQVKKDAEKKKAAYLKAVEDGTAGKRHQTIDEQIMAKLMGLCGKKPKNESTVEPIQDEKDEDEEAEEIEYQKYKAGE